MSLHTKCCIALSILMFMADLALLIAGLPNTRFGLTAVIWVAAGTLHHRFDRLERNTNAMQVLAHAHLRAVERQTDVIKGRR